MQPLLPADANAQPIQTLTPDDSSTTVGTSSGASVRIVIPSGATIVEVAATANVHWTFTTSSGTASTSNKILAGMAVYAVPPGVTHIAFIAAAGVSSAVFTATRLY